MELINREKFSGMNRRTFNKLSGMVIAALLMPATLLLTGCPSFTDISNWITVGLTSVQSIVDLLTGAGAISIPIGGIVDLAVKALKAGIGDIGAAVTAYNNAPAANKATLLGKLGTAITAAQNALAQFWNDLTIPDPKLAATISGLMGIIASTLAYFQTQAPAPATVQLAVLPKRLSFTATKRNPKQFRDDFNTILKGNGFEKYAI